MTVDLCAFPVVVSEPGENVRPKPLTIEWGMNVIETATFLPLSCVDSCFHRALSRTIIFFLPTKIMNDI